MPSSNYITDMSSDDRRSDFNQCWAVLRGATHLKTDEAAVKALKVAFFPEDGTDAWVRPDEFEMRFVSSPTKRRHLYFTNLAPILARAIMTRMGVSHVTAPIVGALHPSRATFLSLGERERELVAWIFPQNDSILFCLRPLVGDERPATGPIPAEGPWRQPPPLPYVKPPERRYSEFPGGLACRRCGNVATSYRLLSDDFLVCAACGCSFE